MAIQPGLNYLCDAVQSVYPYTMAGLCETYFFRVLGGCCLSAVVLWIRFVIASRRPMEWLFVYQQSEQYSATDDTKTGFRR